MIEGYDLTFYWEKSTTNSDKYETVTRVVGQARSRDYTCLYGLILGTGRRRLSARLTLLSLCTHHKSEYVILEMECCTHTNRETHTRSISSLVLVMPRSLFIAKTDTGIINREFRNRKEISECMSCNGHSLGATLKRLY